MFDTVSEALGVKFHSKPFCPTKHFAPRTFPGPTQAFLFLHAGIVANLICSSPHVMKISSSLTK